MNCALQDADFHLNCWNGSKVRSADFTECLGLAVVANVSCDRLHRSYMGADERQQRAESVPGIFSV